MLISKLQDLGLYEDSLICVTADHGESHGEHGEGTHGYFIYTSTIQVPLMLKVPGSRAPLRVEDPVGIVDVPPTVLSLLGIPFDSDIDGRDLSGFIRGQSDLYPGRPIFTMALEPRKFGASSLLGIIVDDFKYIHTTRPELYDLARDAYEQRDLIDADPDRARRMRTQLEEILEISSSPAVHEKISIEADTRELLESLGYIVIDGDDSVPDLDNTAPDPKDLIEYQQKAVIAMSYVVPENRRRAMAAAEGMIEMRPDFYLGYLMMGRALFASGRQNEAHPFFETARRLSPKSALDPSPEPMAGRN
jgi:hypothetical protein